MTEALILFPERAPIGYVVIGGQRYAVMLSKEFFRALGTLTRRVGGSDSDVALTQTLPDIMAPFIGEDPTGTGLALEAITPGATEPDSSAGDPLMLVSVPDLQTMIQQAVAAEISMQQRQQHDSALSFEMTMPAGDLLPQP